MKRFKNILFYADGDQIGGETFGRVLQLAQSNQAGLTVLDIVAEAELADEVKERYGINLNDLLIEKRREEIERLLEPFKTGNLNVEVIIANDSPFVELIQSVQERGFDLLIKEAHPAEVLTEYLFGSFDLHLFRKCPCPVWIDRVQDSRHYRTIIAAVDPDNQSNADLNRLIMDLATSLAERESAELHVIHAWNIEEENFLTSGRALISTTELRILKSAKQQRHREALNKLLSAYAFSDESNQVHLVNDKPARAISTCSQKLNADLIVMGTVGKNRMPGIIIGNTAEDVLQSTQTSVLAVKPDDFVTPIIF
jgi:nucleotide-binding universal stress UspA family protein